MQNKNTHGFAARLLTLAKKHRMKIAIGIDQPNQEIVKNLKAAKKIADLVIVGKKLSGFECIELGEPGEIANKLIELADTHYVDAVVRGQIHPRFLFLPLFQRLGMKSSYFTGEKQESVCVFENKKTKRFFVLSTAELGQGYNLEQKKFEAMAMVRFLKGYGITPYVGVMAMRRGRPKNAKPIKGFKQHPLIDQTYGYAEELLKYLKKRGIKCDFFNIEYETALGAGVNIIIPPIGAVGNAFARSLTFLSESWEGISMSTPHFRPLIMQHSFKTGHGKLFYNIIIAAAAEAVQKKYQVKR